MDMSGFPWFPGASPYSALPPWSDLNVGHDDPGVLFGFATEANLELDEADFGFIAQLLW